jgi:hypothetical protein
MLHKLCLIVSTEQRDTSICTTDFLLYSTLSFVAAGITHTEVPTYVIKYLCIALHQFTAAMRSWLTRGEPAHLPLWLTHWLKMWSGLYPSVTEAKHCYNRPHLRIKHVVRPTFGRTYQFNLILTKLNFEAPQQTLSQLLPCLLPVEYLTCLPCLWESKKNGGNPLCVNRTQSASQKQCSRLCLMSAAHIPWSSQCLTRTVQHSPLLQPAFPTTQTNMQGTLNDG